MIYVLSGGGVGAMLTVNGVAGDKCTITGNGKTYTKTFNAGGQAIFKGLQTSYYDVTMTDGSQTATKRVGVWSAYSTTLTYFAATIQITYPATSTCTVTNSSGAQVATNTNTATSAKTWAATVGAADTYTITATATDGSGKSKTTTVEITADGQSEIVTLTYELLLFSPNNEHSDVTGGWDDRGTGGSASIGSTMSLSIEGFNTTVSYSVYTLNDIDLSKYSILRAQVASCTLSNSTCNARMYAGDAYVAIEGEGQVELDISKITGASQIRFRVSSYSGTAKLEISKVTLL